MCRTADEGDNTIFVVYEKNNTFFDIGGCRVGLGVSLRQALCD